MKILVTGTAGFIGYHLAKVANSGCEANFPRKKLLERGDKVVGTNVMFNDEFLIFNEIPMNNNSKFKIHHLKLYKNLAFASSSSVYGLNESQPFKTTDKTEHQVSLYPA